MFENLQDKLERAFKNLKGQGAITELNIAATLKDIRRALVDADVNYKIAKQFTNTVKDKALGEEVLTAVSPSQLIVKIVNDELAKLMGGTATELQLTSKPAVILIAGLQGSGKTTFSAKLANLLRSRKAMRPLMVACDVYRPAAIDQLQILGEAIKVPVYTDKNSRNPIQIALDGLEYAKQNNNNLVIIDTAGRLAIDEQMMNEITSIKDETNPDEILFVVDSMTGQDAVNTAKTFNERLDYNGVVLTKLDGDTRGGAAITIKYVVDKPIKFISYGEKMETIDIFYPDRMANRILGMGDIISFVERAQMQYDEEEAKNLEKKIRKNTFDFNDFLSQMSQVRKMGSMKDIASMIPGMGKALKNVEIDESRFKRIEAMIKSMTPTERSNPDLLDSKRRRRIAYGSGNSITDVNRFIKEFENMRKMLKTVSKLSSSGRSFKGLPFGKKRR
ncbi:MAG: signal recognition particle protein [Chitinophagales bacterium]